MNEEKNFFLHFCFFPPIIAHCCMQFSRNNYLRHGNCEAEEMVKKILRCNS